MAFTTDFSNIKEFSDFKEKFYEMIVYDAYEDVSQGGKKHIVIDYVVRNDIDQDKQNAHLWDRQYRMRDTGKYHVGILMSKVKALGIQEGKSYESIEDLLKDFIGRPAKIKIELQEYNGQKYPRAKYTNATDFPNVQHQWKDKPTFGISADNLKEDELPF